MGQAIGNQKPCLLGKKSKPKINSHCLKAHKPNIDLNYPLSRPESEEDQLIDVEIEEIISVMDQNYSQFRSVAVSDDIKPEQIHSNFTKRKHENMKFYQAIKQYKKDLQNYYQDEVKIPNNSLKSALTFFPLDYQIEKIKQKKNESKLKNLKHPTQIPYVGYFEETVKHKKRTQFYSPNQKIIRPDFNENENSYLNENFLGSCIPEKLNSHRSRVSFHSSQNSKKGILKSPRTCKGKSESNSCNARRVSFLDVQ